MKCDSIFLFMLQRFSDDPSIEARCSYKPLGDGKAGCDLQPTANTMFIGFVATVNNTLVRNTFEKHLLDDGKTSGWFSFLKGKSCWSTLHFLLYFLIEEVLAVLSGKRCVY